MDAVVDTLEGGVVLVDEEYTVTDANTAASALLDEDDPVGVDVREVLPRSAEATFHRTFGGDSLEPATHTFEEYFPQLDRWLRVRTVPLEADDRGVMTVTVRDIDARKAHDQELSARSRELETLSQIVGIVEAIVERVTGAADRTAIDQYVVDQLVTTDLYDTAWIGSRDLISDGVECRSAAGTASDDLIAATEDGGLEHRALDTGEVQEAHSLAETDVLPESVRRVAFAQGFQSGLAVPFDYGDTIYGVLGLYTTRTDAFREAERDGFDALGTVIGYVIHAIRQEQLLRSDTVVELTFGTTPRADALGRVAGGLDTDLRVRGVVPRDGARLAVFAEFDGGAAETAVDLLTDADTVDSARVVREFDDGGVVEAQVVESSLLARLHAQGGTVTTATFDPDGGSIVAEFAPSEDLSTVVDTIVTPFDGVELIAKREQDSTVETAREFRSRLRGRLTDRQETVLRTSYLADYFENPRGSTGEEIAESLDVTSPTVHHHLRAGQRKLLDAFFEEFEGQ